MENNRTPHQEHLIKMYEERKGGKGQFSFLIEAYESLILSMYNDDKLIFNIIEAIEKDMNYSFTKLKFNKRDPFYRAIQNFIKKDKPKRVGNPVKIGNPMDNITLTQVKNPEKRVSKRVNMNQVSYGAFANHEPK